MGDLNADLLNESDDAKFVRKLSAELSLQLIQHGPTHHTPTSHTWIDVIFVDDNDVVTDKRNTPTGFHSRHNIIEASIQCNVQPVGTDSFTYRDFKSITASSLCEYLACCDWTVFQEENPQTVPALACLCDNLTAAINELAPMKKFTPKKNRLPWIGAELAQLHKKRDAAYRRYKRTGRTEFLDEFLELRKHVDVTTSDARTRYYQDRLLDALENNKVWKELKNLGLLPKQEEDLNGFSPDELNRHFASVSVSGHCDEEEREQAVADSPNVGFLFKVINVNDVVIAVSHFSSQSRGEDGIPQSVIAKALPVIGHFLVKIFNSSLVNGVFPEIWGKARIMPLKKCTAPSSVKDFRPIALLCFLSKVLEKIAHDQIQEYLAEKHILDPLQTGFRKHHSTQTALLKLTDDIRLGIDKKLVTILLLFDFSKAFDTISHFKLLTKLRLLGFSGTALRWINSYLSCRKQCVCTNIAGNSDWLGTNLGVPQGSVLGPLLFCLYINDLRNVVSSSEVKHILYADDLQVYVQVPRENLAEGLHSIRLAAKAVSDWAAGACLRLNAEKTKVTIFGTNSFVNEFFSGPTPHLQLESGVSIPFSNSVTSLGVVLDSKLSWKPHVDHITKKFNRVLYSLRFFRQYTTEDLRKQLATALLFPHLDYCSVVLIDASLELRNRLQILQNSCVRYVLGVRRDDHISPHRAALGWLRIDTRRQYFLAVLMYKIMRMNLPEYLSTFFTRYIPRVATRGEIKDLAVPRMRTSVGINSFQVQGAHLWNTLPAEIRHLPSLSRFKLEVRRYLFNLD